MGKAKIKLGPEALTTSNPTATHIKEIDTRPLDGGGYVAVYRNERTDDVFAELMYRGCGCAACGSMGIFRQWLLEPDVAGRIDVKDVLEHPMPHMLARKGLGYLATGEYDG